MKNKNTPAIVIGVTIILGALLLLLFRPSIKKEKTIDWKESYNPANMQSPYGTGIIRELLKDYHKGKKFATMEKSISKSLRPSLQKRAASYVFIGNYFWVSDADLDTLCAFVENGNQAFISCHEVSEAFMQRIYAGECGDWYGYNSHSSKVINMNFFDSTFRITNAYTFDYRSIDSSMYNWKFINGSYFCDSAAVFDYLAYIDSFYVNYMRIPYGKGSFLVHTTPLTFTNYQLKKESGLEYAGKTFSYLNDGDIYWDEYLNINMDAVKSEGNNSKDSSSPFKFILAQEALRWAWYLILALALIYLIFHARRRQRAIPVLEPNTNTSLGFVKTIGRLYYQQNEPRKISLQKMKLFLFFIRQRYHLPTQALDEELISKISVKSGIARDTVKTLFDKFKLLEASYYDFNEQELISLHQSIDYFYKNCK